LNEDFEMTETAERIRDIVTKDRVVLFMKGTPLFPQCGFSNTATQILDHLGVEFASVDVLQDPEIRNGIKEFSDWPTIPQLYIDGEFIGGSDIMMEMYQAGELHDLLGIETPSA
jgi:monothiol glutaredoxin